MKLDINGYNATFRTFVEFAEKTQRAAFGSDPCDTVDVIRLVPFDELPPLLRQAVCAAA